MLILFCVSVFFFKHKTAYEMRISDWSSDVCSTDLGPMLAREYVSRYLPATTVSRAESIAGEVRKALAGAVDRSTWMSEPAKAEAREKLEKLKIEVGRPKRDLDYSVQPMGRGRFGGNMLIASTWRPREEMKRIGNATPSRHSGGRRVGKGWGSTHSFRVAPLHKKKKNK